MGKYDFGYPKACSQCSFTGDCSNELRVEPHYQDKGAFRLMLVGQDPTIRKDPGRVKEVLMLNDGNSQLRRWLSGLMPSKYDEMTIYATNVVKCTFDRVPTDTDQGGIRFLERYFERCKSYLVEEIRTFRPNVVLALGEPAHKFFISILNDCRIPEGMKSAFTGRFTPVQVESFEFLYSPCLHIQTFRVAETYGDSVNQFKYNFSSLLNEV